MKGSKGPCGSLLPFGLPPEEALFSVTDGCHVSLKFIEKYIIINLPMT